TSDILITPNPANRQAVISFNLLTRMPVRLYLTDLSGKKLFDTGVRNYLPGIHSLPVDIRNYPAGAYLVTLQSGNRIFTEKLIVTGK
ncbi:T9SS type A sorting domain-containing protein, partial [Lentimicrobium sp.]